MAGLTKSGSGVLVLTGSELFTGNTTISAGTLQVGAASATGVLPSGTSVSITSGMLAYDRSDAPNLGFNISGNGGVTQMARARSR